MHRGNWVDPLSRKHGGNDAVVATTSANRMAMAGRAYGACQIGREGVEYRAGQVGRPSVDTTGTL